MRYLISIVTVLGFVASATADVVKLEVVDNAGSIKCTGERHVDATTSSVSLNRKAMRVNQLKVCSSATDCKAEATTAPKQDFTFVGVDLASATLKVLAGEAVTECTVTAAVAEPPVPKVQPPARVGLSAIDIEAETWLTQPKGVEAIEAIQKRLKGNVLVLHLPSGALSSLSPASVREDARIQFAYLYERTTIEGVTLAVEKCNELTLFRINGDSLRLGAAKSDEVVHAFGIALVGPARECGAGTLEYSMTVGTAEAQRFVIPLRPVFALSTAFVYGFDFGRSVSYSVKSKKVAEEKDRHGTSFYAGFTWHLSPDGIDPQDHRTRFGDPFVAFNLEAPTEDVLVGFKVAARRGIGLALGVALKKSVVLNGVTVGQAYEAEAPPPTRKEWDKHSMGFFFGVNFDATSVLGVRKVFGAK